MTEQPRRRKSLEEQIVEETEKPVAPIEELVGPDRSKITEDRLIPSGVTMINCGCSDNPFGAFVMGSINTIPGKSSSGKTELMLNMLATCAKNKRFDDYELIDDDAEHSMNFDLEYLFPPLVGRLKAPRYDGDVPIFSKTIQNFEANILSYCKGKKPFIYILDSLDSLSSTEEMEREWANALKNMKDKESLRDIQQTYNTEKAKKINEILRMVNSYINKSDSALFIIQQTKQNMNKTGMFDVDWVTSGGEAPFFYSFHRLYLNTGAKITDESRGIKHQIGGTTHCQIIKNKLTGKKRKDGIDFNIYDDFGIDDIDSCIDFLKRTGEFYMEGSYMVAPGISNQKMYRKDLISFIEKENAETELQKIVGKVWNEIEDDIRLKDRKRRF